MNTHISVLPQPLAKIANGDNICYLATAKLPVIPRLAIQYVRMLNSKPRPVINLSIVHVFDLATIANDGRV